MCQIGDKEHQRGKKRAYDAFHEVFLHVMWEMREIIARRF